MMEEIWEKTIDRVDTAVTTLLLDLRSAWAPWLPQKSKNMNN
jgi:hypothetical protein